MLQRIDELLKQKVDFAIETALSTRSYVPMLKKVQQNGYNVTLLYLVKIASNGHAAGSKESE